MNQLVPSHLAGQALPIANLPFTIPPPPPERDISFAQVFRTIKKRKWIILLTVIVAMVAAWEVSIFMTPKYEAAATIEVNKEASDMIGDAMSSMIEDSGAGDSLDYNITLQTHAKALQSDTLTFQVANQLHLENRPEFRLVPTLFPLLTPTPLTQEKVDAEYRRSLDESPLRRARLSKAFAKNMTVKAVPGTRLIEVHFLNPDPQVATDVVNRLVGDYIEGYFRTRYAATAQASDWLSNQLSDLKKDVETSEQKLAETRRRAGLLGTDDDVHSLTIVRLEELDKELTDAEANRILAEAVNRIVKTGDPELISVAAAGSSLVANQTSASPLSLLQNLRAQQAQVKMQYAQAATKYGAAFPALVQLRNQLTDLDSSINQERSRLSARAENDYQVAKASEDRIRQEFDTEKGVADRLNDAAVQYAVQKHEVEVKSDLYGTLLGKLKGAGILSGLQSTNLVVVDPARTTPDPARPIYPLNLAIGLSMGLLGGIAFAFIAESTDNTLRTPEQVEEVAALPTLTVVPEFHGSRIVRRAARKEPRIWSLDYPSSAAAEAYRLLRTSVLLTQIDCPPKVIIVTSALPRDGKSTTSINIAVALAQQGRKVLLVDADLRRPKVKASLSLALDQGLTEMIAGSDPDQPLLQPRPDVPTLSVLASGRRPPNPAEMLGSAKMADLVRRWREEFDFVIIDTPPVLAVTDPVVVSQYADAVIFVVCYKQTTKQSLVRARDLLLRANARISGVVVNRMNVNSSDHYESYGYYAYQQRGYYNEARN